MRQSIKNMVLAHSHKMSWTFGWKLSAMAERGVIDEPFAAWSPAGALGHVGLQPGFVDKGEPFQHMRHKRLTAGDPMVALLGHLGPLLLKRLQVFFCV